MGLDRRNVIGVTRLVVPGVTASGKYTLDEMLQHTVACKNLAAIQYTAMQEVLKLHSFSDLDVSGEPVEDQAAFVAGHKVALRVLVSNLRTALRKMDRATPHDVRDTYLQLFLEEFDTIPQTTPGHLTQEESGMNPTIFNIFDADSDGLITKEDLQGGLSQ